MFYSELLNTGMVEDKLPFVIQYILRSLSKCYTDLQRGIHSIPRFFITNEGLGGA